MSKKKFNDKAELFQELKERLEELFTQVESAEIHFNHLEHQDYMSMVVKPFGDLLEDVEVFATNLENGIYDSDRDGDVGEGYED
jgi:hypothetical protein